MIPERDRDILYTRRVCHSKMVTNWRRQTRLHLVFKTFLRCPADVSFADKRLKHVSQTSSKPKLTKDVFVTKTYVSLGIWNFPISKIHWADCNGCASWSAPLLFTNPEDRFSCIQYRFSKTWAFYLETLYCFDSWDVSTNVQDKCAHCVCIHCLLACMHCYVNSMLW